MAVQDYKINYKSDFVLTINGDAGWATQFCIKFWTGMPSQAYFVGFDGVKYVNCRVGDTPTQLLVMFDDHHLPIGKLEMQIAYHTTIEEFPGSVFDEVTNARDVIVNIDGTDYQVLLDFTGEDAPELEFNLPAYANEAERIQNELQRQQNEADRIAAELQREQTTAAAVQGAENVNAQLNGTTLTVTNRNGVSTSVNTKGEQGERGPAGPEGPQGETGISITGLVKTGETETDTLYNATFSDGTTQAVAIPKGAKGDTGATGPTGPQGPQGQTGVSITGLVKTGETETDTLYNVTFSNGTTQAVAIPKGAKGDQGEQGPQGPQGPMGDVAVITPEQQAAFTMYSTTGQNTDGPMTQKAVTDEITELVSNLLEFNARVSNGIPSTTGKWLVHNRFYGKWYNLSPYAGMKLRIKANATVTNVCLLADKVFTTNNEVYTTHELGDGYFSVTANTEKTVNIPSNAYLFILTYNNGTNATPAGLDVLSTPQNNVEPKAEEKLILDDYDYVDSAAQSNGKWLVYNGVHSYVIPRPTDVKLIRVTAHLNALYSYVKSITTIHTSGGTVDVCDNCDYREASYESGTYYSVVPNDCNYIIVRSDTPGELAADVFFIRDVSPAITDLYNGLKHVGNHTNYITIAASDSTYTDKALADYVCSGVNDEAVIQTAINSISGDVGTIILYSGTYQITTFTTLYSGVAAGIVLPKAKSINIYGQQDITTGYNKTVLKVNESAYNALSTDVQYSMIVHDHSANNTYNLSAHVKMRNLTFEIYDNQKKIICVDAFFTGLVDMYYCHGVVTLRPGKWGGHPEGLDVIPNTGCVFFKGQNGNQNAVSRISHCSATSFYIGHAVQGEHIYVENTAAVNCMYGFAFNYFTHNQGMQVHPMILVNCVEEGCCNYPYFGYNPQKQSIYIINHHYEHRNEFFNQGGNYATEQTAGQWYGFIDYVIQYFPTTSSVGNEVNAVNIPFWADGSGVNMRSVNDAQKRIVTSTERNDYAANYFQQVFDITLNKLLICTDPATNKWVDANGTIV